MVKKNYYFVEDNSYGQRGTHIETLKLKLTKRAYRKIKKVRNYQGRPGFITDEYRNALYYTLGANLL